MASIFIDRSILLVLSISDNVDGSLFANDEEWSLEKGNNIKKLKENGIKTLFKLVFFIFILYLDFFIIMLKIYSYKA